MNVYTCKILPLQKCLPLSEAEIQGLLHPGDANRGYFLAWFQSLQLPSTQSESPLALIPLAPKCQSMYSTVDRIEGCRLLGCGGV
jgi:hypothetical protein